MTQLPLPLLFPYSALSLSFSPYHQHFLTQTHIRHSLHCFHIYRHTHAHTHSYLTLRPSLSQSLLLALFKPFSPVFHFCLARTFTFLSFTHISILSGGNRKQKIIFSDRQDNKRSGTGEVTHVSTHRYTLCTPTSSCGLTTLCLIKD